MNIIILKVLVGGRAHGLVTSDSDFDYRAVYVTPTSKILSLGHKYKGSHFLEGKEDQTTYEIGHFLHLATKCNSTILEVFRGPKQPIHTPPDNPLENIKIAKISNELINLFSCVWNPKDAFNAFTGYGVNQRKKMLENKDHRWQKYAVAYLRTLYNLISLLETGDFSLKIEDQAFKSKLIDIKQNQIMVGEVVNIAKEIERAATSLLSSCKQQPNLDKVNKFLIKIRKEFWE